MRKFVLLSIPIVTLSVVVAAVLPHSAAAFNRSDLMSNAVYLNDDSMSQSEIQSFLVSKHSYLANYKDQGPNETKKMPASYLIWHAGQIWHINPQVILATLQKEQSLVTMQTYNAGAYNAAMGYGCFDTSACQAAYKGFAKQVNMATYQFRYNYEVLMGNSSFKDIDGDTHPVGTYACRQAIADTSPYYNRAIEPGNKVTFTRNTGISGTKNVTLTIASAATASFYCYTPHSGPFSTTGYSGSDNLYTVFTNWFGSTHYTTYGAIGNKYSKLNGASGFLGEILSNEIKLKGGGRYQKFSGGRIYWSHNTGAWSVHGGIENKYLDLGGSTSFLGYPISDEIAINNGVYQKFEHGRIYWSKGVGAWSVHGGIENEYMSLGGYSGNLGLPISEEVGVSSGVYQEFKNGRIYWSSSTGAAPLTSDILDYYKSHSNSLSAIGFPLDGQKTSTDGVYQRFQKANLYISGGDLRLTYGGIRTRYLKLDGANGGLGFPISNQTNVSGGVYQEFKNGRIYWSKSTGAWDIMGEIGVYYSTVNYSDGYLGFPISSATTSGGTSSQKFQKGVIYNTHDGTYDIHGGIANRYDELEDEQKEYLGYPTSGELPLPDGGRYQTFENGRIYWKSGVGAWDTHGGIGEKYQALGADQSYLGLPKSGEIKIDDGAYQKYQNGRIYWSSRTGAWSTHGGIQSHYLQLGGPDSRLGLPTSDELVDTVNGGVYQKYQGGTIHWRNDGWSKVYYY